MFSLLVGKHIGLFAWVLGEWLAILRAPEAPMGVQVHGIRLMQTTNAAAEVSLAQKSPAATQSTRFNSWRCMVTCQADTVSLEQRRLECVGDIIEFGREFSA